MKAAFTIWNDRIAPLFDVARQVLVVESEEGRVVRRSRVSLDGEMPARKAQQLAEMGVRMLVCGAISRSGRSMVGAYGIELVSFINGDLQAVIDAWQQGTLSEDDFLMPGCKGHRGRRFQNNPSSTQGERPMNPNTMSGRGQGGGGQGRRGQKGGKQGRGRQDFGAGAGAGPASDVCVCPKCGHREPHQRGVPCMNRVCSQCGAAMTRQ